MARVRVVRHVQVGGRRLPVKRVPRLASIIPGTQVEATAVQLRVMAEEARELIIDKLFAGQGDAPAAQRPNRLRRQQVLTQRSPFPHRPLRRWVRRRKQRRGHPGPPLIETGDYLRGIEVFKGQQQSGVYYMVRPEIREHEGYDEDSTRIMLSKLARVHELGSRRHRIPKRPHWGPATRDVIRAFQTQATANVRADVLRRLLQGLA